MRLMYGAALLLGLGLAACAGGPEKPAPAVRHEAVDAANRRSAAHFAKGEYAAALDQARRALKLASAVEYDDGIAASRLNLSIILARMGQPQDARGMVDALLAGNLRVSPERRTEAALRRAVLALDERDLDHAEKLLDIASAGCAACKLVTAIGNARAQLSLARGQLDDALVQSGAALDIGRKGGEAEETANSLRIWANAAIYAGRAPEASVALSEALKIDKELALPRKIYRDLILLGLASRAQGDPSAAIAYWSRANVVAQGADDAAGGRESAELIKDLEEKGKERQ